MFQAIAVLTQLQLQLLAHIKLHSYVLYQVAKVLSAMDICVVLQDQTSRIETQLCKLLGEV